MLSGTAKSGVDKCVMGIYYSSTSMARTFLGTMEFRSRHKLFELLKVNHITRSEEIMLF